MTYRLIWSFVAGAIALRSLGTAFDGHYVWGCFGFLFAVWLLIALVLTPRLRWSTVGFRERDRVEKVDGYHYPGVVVCAFDTLAGKRRYVVEADSEDFAGMLHIFSGAQLKNREDKR